MLPFKYATPSFLKFINTLYDTPQKMHENIAKLTYPDFGNYSLDPNAPNSIHALKWGDYQPILVPTELWPGETGAKWKKAAANARASLQLVANDEPVDDADPANVPRTRCELLDALVRKCFTTPAAGQSKPGIPMIVDVSEKPATDPNRNLHDIVFYWKKNADGQPVALYLTMICAYKGSDDSTVG